MPLSAFRRPILTTLASRRTPERDVAGGSPVTARPARISADVDAFDDCEDLVEAAATADAAALAETGHTVRWDRQLPGIWSGIIEGGPEKLKLEWAHDPAYRFYPAMADPQFGFVLHPADLMTEKVLAAAGRSAARDLVDMVTLSDEVPIAAAILAAVGKDPGMPHETVMNTSRCSVDTSSRPSIDLDRRTRSTGPRSRGRCARASRRRVRSRIDRRRRRSASSTSRTVASSSPTPRGWATTASGAPGEAASRPGHRTPLRKAAKRYRKCER